MNPMTQGKPFETPDAQWNNQALNSNPGIAATVPALLGSGVSNALLGAGERGINAPDASYFDKAVAGIGQNEAEQGAFVSPPQPPKEPLLPADEINKRYAPEGSKITDKPMSDTLGSIIGKQKLEEITRDRVIGRYEDAHGTPANLATEALGFIMDPINASTMFVPGFGEESIAARLGGGFLARTAGRAVAGGIAVGAGQAPLIAGKYLLGKEQASDYGIADALKDEFFSAASGAIFHAGLGAIGEAFKTPEAKAIAEAPSGKNYTAMKSAVSQIQDGRQIDVEPFFGDKSVADVASDQQELRRNGFSPGISDEGFNAAHEVIYGEKPPEMAKPSEGESKLDPGVQQSVSQAEEQFQALQAKGLEPSPEDAALIKTADNQVAKANDNADAMKASADCIGAAQ